jgi:outer membrane protein TolC
VQLLGRFCAAGGAARGHRAAARFNYEGARASLAANVADGYFQVRGLAIQLADARETARIQHALQALANTRAERGLGSAADADRVAGEVAQADGQVANLEAELQAARRALLILVGRGIEPTTNLPAVAGVGKIPAVPASVPSDLLRRRPDIREAEARVQSAAGRLAAAQMAFLPTFDLTPGLGWSKNEQPGFSSTSQSWSMGVNVSQPILNIPTLLLQMRAQDARTEQAVIAYEKTVQAAFGEAESSLVRLASDRRRVGLLTDGEMRAGRAYEASRVRYAAGIDDLQTALSAEQGWRATRSQLTAAQVQALRRAVQAMKALGGGWQAQTIPTNAQAR